MTNTSHNYKPYLFRYQHAGQSWGFEILAESPEDARQRVSRLAWATFDGEVMAKVPVTLGIPARLFVAARNLGRRMFGLTNQ